MKNVIVPQWLQSEAAIHVLQQFFDRRPGDPVVIGVADVLLICGANKRMAPPG